MLDVYFPNAAKRQEAKSLLKRANETYSSALKAKPERQNKTTPLIDIVKGASSAMRIPQ